MNKNWLKSIGAVLAGALTGIVLSVVTDVVLHAIDVFPSWGQPIGDGPLVLATAYRAIYGIAGTYVTARLAPRKPMQHAMVLGAIGLVAVMVGAAVTWNKGPEFGAHWYPVALIVLALPQSWAGAKLRIMQLHAR